MFQLRHGALALERGSLARFDHNLFRGRDCFLLFALAQMRAAFTRLVDHFLRLCIGFRQNFGVTLLRFGQLLFDLLGVQETLFDAAPPFFQNSENRFVSKTTQQQSDNREADYLREK